MSTHTNDCIEIRVIKSLCKRVRSDYAKLVLSTVVSSGYAEDLPELSPSTYTDPKTFALDYAIYSFLKKWKGWRTRVKPKDRAFAAWLAAERKCFETNRRLTPESMPMATLNFISKIQRKISLVIGDEPVLETVFSECRWGNGATSSLKRPEATIAQKQTNVLSITRDALPLFQFVTDGDAWLEVLPGYSYARGNRGVMVPKTSKVDRPIAAEPTGNSFLQQGVGRYIRRRLKKFDVDLDDQSVNQGLAFAAQLDGLSTIDLSSASDTLAVGAVELLLPPKWFALLSKLRSKTTCWDGKIYHLSKFSSMGNAFTFELESLVFWAISKVVVESLGDPSRINTISVYGDDIIVPAYLSQSVIESLEFFGFIVNWEKSYLSGSFYESCGRQYFDMEDVTPPYQKEVVNNSLYELIRLHNRLYRWGMRSGCMKYILDSLAEVKTFTIKSHPKLKTMPLIPFGSQSDVGFLSQELKADRNGDYKCKVLVEVPDLIYLFRDNEIRGLYAYKLRMQSGYSNADPDGSASESLTPRTRLTTMRIWASSLS